MENINKEPSWELKLVRSIKAHLGILMQKGEKRTCAALGKESIMGNEKPGDERLTI